MFLNAKQQLRPICVLLNVKEIRLWIIFEKNLFNNKDKNKSGIWVYVNSSITEVSGSKSE